MILREKFKGIIEGAAHNRHDDLRIDPRSRSASDQRPTGFTLIELLIVISITVILAGVSSVVYGNLQLSTQLNETSAQIAQNLRLAREQSTSGLNNAGHGVKFAATQYTIYQGSSYAARDSSYDRVYAMDSALTLSTTLVGNEILFSKGVGVASTTGTVTVTHSVSGSRVITINSQGIILEQ